MKRHYHKRQKIEVGDALIACPRCGKIIKPPKSISKKNRDVIGIALNDSVKIDKGRHSVQIRFI